MSRFNLFFLNKERKMEIKKTDFEMSDAPGFDGELKQLADLELAVIGGGMGDVAF